MGKNRGAYNLFESYVASGLASSSYSSSFSADIQHNPLPDSMKCSTLLEQIGKEHKWSKKQIETDIIILDNNRLYYVSDLRELSKSSWKSIELLPLVKDLLRKALYPTCKEKDKAPEEKKDEKKEKKKLEKAAKKEKKKLQRSLGEPVNTEQHFKNRKGETMFTEGVVSEDPETIRNTIQNISIEDKKEQDMKLEIELKGTGERKKSVSFSEDDLITLPEEVKDDSSSSSSSSDSDCTDNKPAPTTKQPKVFSGRPIKAVSGNRIRVLTKDGSVYETDRYCPHKKVDLATWGQILGNQLVCTKHNWNFNLDGLGTKGRNINPCKVNDW